MKKVFIWIAIPILLFILFLIISVIIQLVQYEKLGPVPMSESERFQFSHGKLTYTQNESDQINDTLTFYIEVENISKKDLNQFQFTLKLDDEMKKYTPFITNTMSGMTIKGKNSNPNDLSHKLIATCEILFIKPNLLSENDRKKVLELTKHLTLELSWHNGKEILVFSEKDFTHEVSF